MNFLVGIAGGSGAGKSTLAYGLQNRFPESIEVVHFDDYQKKRAQVPVYEGMTNWDHPDAIDFDKLRADVILLREGKNVEIMTKSARHNPDYETSKSGRIPHVMVARPLIIVEGYMALVNPGIRALYDFSLFLDLSSEERLKRRTKVKDDFYLERILLPMHEIHVEPTKSLAHLVIEVGAHDSRVVQEITLHALRMRGILPR